MRNPTFNFIGVPSIDNDFPLFALAVWGHGGVSCTSALCKAPRPIEDPS